MVTASTHNMSVSFASEQKMRRFQKELHVVSPRSLPVLHLYNRCSAAAPGAVSTLREVNFPLSAAPIQCQSVKPKAVGSIIHRQYLFGSCLAAPRR